MLQFSQIQERLYAAAILEVENRQVDSLPFESKKTHPDLIIFYSSNYLIYLEQFKKHHRNILTQY